MPVVARHSAPREKEKTENPLEEGTTHRAYMHSAEGSEPMHCSATEGSNNGPAEGDATGNSRLLLIVCVLASLDVLGDNIVCAACIMWSGLSRVPELSSQEPSACVQGQAPQGHASGNRHGGQSIRCHAAHHRSPHRQVKQQIDLSMYLARKRYPLRAASKSLVIVRWATSAMNRFADRKGRKAIALLASVGAVLGHSLTAMTGTFAVVMLSRFLLGVVRHGTTTYQVRIRYA